MVKVVLVVNAGTSAAARTPVYLVHRAAWSAWWWE
jgi:hypothetical protein